MRSLKINSFARYKHQVIILCLVLFIEGITSEERNYNCSNIRNYEFEVFKIALRSPEKSIYYQSNTLVTQTIGDQLPINLIEEYGKIGYRVSTLGLQRKSNFNLNLSALDTTLVCFKMYC